VLVVCPPPSAGMTSHRRSQRFCDLLGCGLLDLDGVATYSKLDTHLEEAGGHIAVAAAAERRIRQMLI